jgi:MoaA/NifB/PqqE/SkfB family radical SAM enzyme
MFNVLNLKSIRWDIAQRCNLNCKHCHTGDHRANNYYETTTEEAKRIIDMLYREGVDNVGLLGGEPLIRRDISELISYMYDKGMKVTINTNGLLLTERLLTFLFNNNCTIIVSIDGANQASHEFLRGKGTFDKTINKILLATSLKRRLGAHSPVGLSVVLNQQNKNELNDFFHLAQELDVDILSMQAVYRTGNAEQFWDLLSLSSDEILALGEEYLMIIRDKYNFDIDERFLTNKAIKYLNSRMGTSYKTRFVGDGDGYRTAYIRCDGIMLPSAGLLSLPGEFKENSLTKHTIQEVLQTSIFDEWRALTEKKLYKNYYEPCSTCEFSGVTCFPSPNAYMMHKKTPLDVCRHVDNVSTVEVP